MKKLLSTYRKLLKHFGPQGWWPADSEFEVIVGAILTQSTSWRNVERAIGNLKDEKLLSARGLLKVNVKRLARLVKPALYYNVKARKLKSFVKFLYDRHDGRLDLMLNQPLEKLRKELLSIWGIGPETADSIVLYAAHKPSFVVDAYTRRIFHRMGLTSEYASYDEIKCFFESNLPEDVELYEEYHALIVELGKRYCRNKPACKDCCVRDLCGYGVRSTS